jgi:phosphocarrier protein HPr
MERQVTVNHPEGLHARPAADFVEAAILYKSHIELSYQNKKVNAKSMLGLLKLGIERGQSVVIRADGPDAETAIIELSRILERNE